MKKWYVVFIGRVCGLFDNWDECRAQTSGFPGNRFKSYETYEDAVMAWEAFEENDQAPY